MIKLKNEYNKRYSDIGELNSMAAKDAKNLIDSINYTYHNNIEDLAMRVSKDNSMSKIIMLSGPSSSGKTTTAKMIAECLNEMGTGTKLISLDDFYRGEGMAPQLPNGKFDYEDVEALNIAQVQDCLFSLMQEGYCDKPIFDFSVRKPKPYTERVTLDKNDIAIFEGIHALNPIIYQNLPEDNIVKIFVSVSDCVKKSDEKFMTSREMRFLRRLVRDYLFRSTTAETTLSMWEEVCTGEDKYITPYKNNCDIWIDSCHIYEPCILAPKALSLLSDIDKDSQYYDFVQDIINKTNKFNFIDPEYVPFKSLTREFIGDGFYG